MVKFLGQVLKLALLTFTGFSASVVIGLMVYGGGVFDPNTVGFSFVSYGISGAFIFAFYHVRGLSECITAAVVVSAIQFVLASTWITVLNAGIWSFGVNLPIILVAFLFERKLAPFRQFKFIVVALLYGAMFVTLTLVGAWVTGAGTLPAELFRGNFLDGLLIGLGLGIGLEAGEAFLHSLEHRNVKPHGPVEKHA
jgi:hypothetical protein